MPKSVRPPDFYRLDRTVTSAHGGETKIYTTTDWSTHSPFIKDVAISHPDGGSDRVVGPVPTEAVVAHGTVTYGDDDGRGMRRQSSFDQPVDVRFEPLGGVIKMSVRNVGLAIADDDIALIKEGAYGAGDPQQFGGRYAMQRRTEQFRSDGQVSFAEVHLSPEGDVTHLRLEVADDTFQADGISAYRQRTPNIE